MDQKLFVTALWGGDVPAVEAMIAAGADVNAIEPDGFHPPLHVAIEQGGEAVVGAIVRAGAEVNRPHPTTRTAGGSEWTPLAHAIDLACDVASQREPPLDEVDVGVIQLLLRAGAKPAASAFEMARAYRSAKVEALLEGLRGRA